MFGLRSWRRSLAQWFLITSLWWPNWMGYLQIEWLIIWWLKKPNHPVIHSYYPGGHRALNAEPNARSLVCTRRQPIADEIFLKFGSVTVSRVFPCYVYSRTQNSCVFGFPSRVSQRVGQVTWHPLLTWSWTKNRFLQSSENFHPKLILALEVVVGEEKYPFFFLKHWNEVKSIDRDPRWYTRRVKEAIS